MFRKALFIPVLLLILGAGLGACNKEKDTKATITVLDTAGAPLAGAYVKLFANPTTPLQADFSRLTKEGTTSSDGKITFDYSEFYKRGQAGFAVLDILARKDSLTGEGIIRIEEEQTNEETVVVSGGN
ncbi:MAG: hypothetical protein K8H89_04990 [Flavobacteriales bacterium]|jgi:hypothetical protein|nr:hypothetical protein [Flavobacteriales bacterium]MCB0758158.1 hypothetical protein [Flavobacteriales bacterium]